MNLRKLLEADLFENQTPRFFWVYIARLLLTSHGGGPCVVWIRLSQHFYVSRQMRLSEFCRRQVRRHYGCYVSPRSQIGPGLKLPHPVGIVIGQGVRIGANVRIFQHVTLGGRVIGDMQAGSYPMIGDRVTIFAGACVVGAISVGARSTIGANSVVLSDVPPDAVAVGAPARILTRGALRDAVEQTSGAVT